MLAENFSIKRLLRMAHSPIHNYAIPGLTSMLIGAPSPAGTVRLFQCEREHQEAITPHSHRFAFQCWVLSGSVKNRLWTRSYQSDQEADWYTTTTLEYMGEVGGYERIRGDRHRWRYADTVYGEGECYSMEADQVHSIYFSRGATVLFFEGSSVSKTSIIIEPYTGGETISTLEVKPWMFKKA